jgi:iron complex outermembrane receptor protein
MDTEPTRSGAGAQRAHARNSLRPADLRTPPRLAALSLAIGSAFGAAGVRAQDTAAEPEVQSVTISTGLRGQSKTIAESPNPITVVTAAELEKTGKQNLRDALAAAEPSYANIPQFKGQQGLAVNTASMRGLSGNSVLVLVNGKRRHSSAVTISGIGGTGTDLDLIPMSAVARIEVLKDGAAAQYGSDAIAGVINIVLKADSEGGSGSIGYGQYGASSHVGGLGHKGQTGTFQVSQGFALGEDGFLTLSADFLRQRDTNVAGPVPYPRIALYPKVNGQPDPREATANRYRQIMGLPNTETQNLAYNLELPLTSQISAYSFSTFSHRRSYGFGTYRTPAASQNLISVYPEGFLPEFGVEDNDYQVVAGARGNDLAGWKWDFSTSYGRDKGDVTNDNTLSGSYGAANSKHDFYLGTMQFSESVTNADFSRRFDTGYFEKPLNVSFGAEHRLSVFQMFQGEEQSWGYGGVVPTTGQWAGQPISPGSAGMAGIGPDAAGSYNRVSNALYLDLTQDITKDWLVSVAARYEHYDDVGGVPSGKLSTRYQATKELALRGTYSNGFAAPSLQNSYYTNISSGWNADPITGEWVQGRGRLVPATDAAAKALGAQPLRPEKSRDLSLGLVFTPGPRTIVTLDAYQIEVRDRIVQSTSLNYNVPAIAAILNANGLDPRQSVSYFTNAGTTLTRGLDLVVDHRQRLAEYGQIKWLFTNNHTWNKIKSLNNPQVLTNAGIQLVGRDIQGKLTESRPANIASLSANWTVGKWDTLAKATNYSSVVGRNAVSANRDEYVGSATIFDLVVGYWITDKVKFSVGANNLFDKTPPDLPPEGIQYFGFPVDRPNPTWVAPYGVNGAYYFAKLEASW